MFLNNVVERLAIDGIVNGVGRAVQYSSRQLRLDSKRAGGVLYSDHGSGNSFVFYHSVVLEFINKRNQHYVIGF